MKQQNNLNGDLGYVTVFTLPYDLENIVYSLKANSFSAPFKTKMGYHIFKNVSERKPLGSRRMCTNTWLHFLLMPPHEDKNAASSQSRQHL